MRVVFGAIVLHGSGVRNSALYSTVRVAGFEQERKHDQENETRSLRGRRSGTRVVPQARNER